MYNCPGEPCYTHKKYNLLGLTIADAFTIQDVEIYQQEPHICIYYKVVPVIVCGPGLVISEIGVVIFLVALPATKLLQILNIDRLVLTSPVQILSRNDILLVEAQLLVQTVISDTEAHFHQSQQLQSQDLWLEN